MWYGILLHIKRYFKNLKEQKQFLNKIFFKVVVEIESTYFSKGYDKSFLYNRSKNCKKNQNLNIMFIFTHI